MLAVPLMVGLSLSVTRTRLSKAMGDRSGPRGGGDDGHQLNQTIALTFLLGGARRWPPDQRHVQHGLVLAGLPSG
jgi:hypothetical protein